ncbi:MAG: GNAT family N-acetyltransferase [Oscillospiraceae bacterium]|jgi:GNAT superfamily N-acetyltransferase|nr:GNAT family N-acetyltransferase [Oscillospiraceae bacterium]
MVYRADEKGAGMINLSNQQKAILRQEENEFPKLFTHYSKTDYGYLFYNEGNKDSYDSNHAILLPERVEDLGVVLNDVTAFYTNKGITPAIYHPLKRDYFEKHKNMFSNHGYSVSLEPDRRVFVLSDDSCIVWNDSLDVRRISGWDNRITEHILIPNDQEYEAAVSMEKLKHEGCFVFAGYCGEKAVVYADFHVSPLGCTHFDYIVTAKDERGKGYARQLMHKVTQFCRDQNFPLCATWFANATSERLNIDAGFRATNLCFEAGHATYCCNTAL